MMKKIRSLLIAIAVIAITICATSCSPAMVDAFAYGYRAGYYGEW